METLEIKIGEKYPLTTFEYFEYFWIMVVSQKILKVINTMMQLLSITPTGFILLKFMN